MGHPLVSCASEDRSKNKKPSRPSERVANWLEKFLCGSYYVARLEAFGAFEQIELDGLAFVQRAVAVLLDGREMHEYILAGGALDETVSLRPVEPLHSTLLSHKETPFASLRIILAALLCLRCTVLLICLLLHCTQTHKTAAAHPLNATSRM